MCCFAVYPIVAAKFIVYNNIFCIYESNKLLSFHVYFSCVLFLFDFTAAQIREMSGHGPPALRIQPSRYTWNKWKDYTHFYTLVGVIPVTILITTVNLFIGPATLSPIPEGYRPKHWEYHKVNYL